MEGLLFSWVAGKHNWGCRPPNVLSPLKPPGEHSEFPGQKYSSITDKELNILTWSKGLMEIHFYITLPSSLYLKG